MNHIGIDPGTTKGSAVCFGDSAGLVTRCAFFATPVDLGAPAKIVCELPRIYPRNEKEGRHLDPNDMVDLGAVSGGWFYTNLGNCSYVFPRAWKGTRKKWTHHRVIWNALTDAEKAIVAPVCGMLPKVLERYIDAACNAAALGHKVTYGGKVADMLDAVGLMKYARKVNTNG